MKADSEMKPMEMDRPCKRRGRRHQYLQELGDRTENPAYQGPNLGERLRELRSERGLTLRMLADLSGLNINTLSMIENGRTSPSVATLQQLAGSLQIPLMAFFEVDQPQSEVVCLKNEERPRVSFLHGLIEELGSGMLTGGAQPYLVHLLPGAVSGEQPIVHTGLEFVFCLEGSFEYVVDRISYVLAPNDSLFFKAHLPHSWHNPTSQPARMLLMLCEYGEDDRPVREHFSGRY